MINKVYYHEMLLRDRLIPITKNDKLIGFITYYIGSIENVNRYVRDDPWTIIDDEPTTGEICYVDQMITNKESKNHAYSWQVLKMLVTYIGEKYPQVKFIRWNRYKQGEARVHFKDIRG